MWRQWKWFDTLERVYKIVKKGKGSNELWISSSLFIKFFSNENQSTKIIRLNVKERKWWLANIFLLKNLKRMKTKLHYNIWQDNNIIIQKKILSILISSLLIKSRMNFRMNLSKLNFTKDTRKAQRHQNNIGVKFELGIWQRGPQQGNGFRKCPAGHLVR